MVEVKVRQFTVQYQCLCIVVGFFVYNVVKVTLGHIRDCQVDKGFDIN